MDENSPEPVRPVPSLAAALRTARFEAAERSHAIANLRGVELSRLEMLREALAPIFAQLPEEVDLFDTGLVPGEHPRLFIDMIAFVDMARDRRTYRFHLDTRQGRVLIEETENHHLMVAKVTAYVARRLVERERALSDFSPEDFVAPPPAPDLSEPSVPLFPYEPPPVSSADTPMARLARRGIQGLGVVALLWIGLHFVQGRLPGW